MQDSIMSNMSRVPGQHKLVTQDHKHCLCNIAQIYLDQLKLFSGFMTYNIYICMFQTIELKLPYDFVNIWHAIWILKNSKQLQLNMVQNI